MIRTMKKAKRKIKGQNIRHKRVLRKTFREPNIAKDSKAPITILLL